MATQSTESEAPAEAASDAPTGSPAQPNPTLPDGFDGLDDGWHSHDWLCFYPNGTVTLDDQPTCTSRGGSYQTNVGWLLHLWSYVPNPDSRFTEDNPKFYGLP